jgi:hypothetical protein
MDSWDSRVIIVRAWRESDGIRIRLLAEGDPRRQWVLTSIAEAGDLLATLLAELPAPAHGPVSETDD